MKYARIAKDDAENAKRLLSNLGMFDRSRNVRHSSSYVYFPVLDTDAKAKKLISKAKIEIVEARGAKPAIRRGYNERLSRILSREEMGYTARGYELLGNIAIIEASERLRRKEKAIAEALMDSNPRVKTVLAKAGAVRGVYRRRRLRYISGIRDYVATYNENGCTFRFDVRRVFFSGKLSYERSRVSSLAHDREHVIVVGAGVGPFAIEIAKRHPSTRVIGIELNMHARKYMLGNIKMNKTPNVKAELGDVRKVYKRHTNYADRIIMPVPVSSLRFLDSAIAMAKKRATIHMYLFGSSGSVLADAWEKIRRHAKTNGYKAKLLSHRIVRPYSAREVEVVIDFGIDKGHNQ